MTRPDILLGAVTMLMAVLGAAAALHAPSRTWQKIAYALAFVVLGAFGVYFTVRQSNETTAANTKLSNALSDVSKATSRIQESNAAEARARDQNTKLQQRLLDSNATISKLAQQGIDTATGGSGFCYLQFAYISEGKGLLFAIPQGEYPLYGVKARVVDLGVFDKIVKQGRQPGLGITYDVGDMTYVAAFPVATIPFNDPESQDFNIFFSARNGIWSEKVRLRKVHGTWVGAIAVTRPSKKNRNSEDTIFEKIDKGFPEDAIDWKRPHYVRNPGQRTWFPLR